MGKLVVLKLDGDFDRGFWATLEIGLDDERPEVEMRGDLPPATELVTQYSGWQSSYRSLGKAKRIIYRALPLLPTTHRIRLKRVKQDSYRSRYRTIRLFPATRAIRPIGVRIDGSLKKKREECRTQASELRDRLNSWLKTESFLSIRETWLQKVSTSDNVRVLIRTNNFQLWQLPWNQWDLLEQYNQPEIALSTLEYERPPRSEPPHREPFKILAILGNREGINVEEDRKQLENLPNAATTFLIEPQRQQLSDQLWEQSWDILFFAGHSRTEGQRGRIYLNQTDSLTLDELKYALKKAVKGGLQLAIFNSCDGLGLARELKLLHIPQLIVMREPVPDRVAQEFLRYFLHSFSNGKPLYAAVQEARQRLQGLENNFPCASWLPVMCQNPAAVPLKWPEPSPPIQPASPTRPSLPVWRRFSTIFVTSLVVTSVLMGARWMGVLQKWELQSYDQLLRQRPSESADSRILLVGADENDIRQYKHPIPDAVLAQLIEKLEQYRPVAIGLDIYRYQPVPPGHESLVTQLQKNQRLVTACALGNNKEDSIAPPPNSPAEQQSFVDLQNDQDYIIRRHLQSRTPNPISAFSPCETPYSFSWQLAYRYLKAKGIATKTTPEKNWQFGSVVSKRLEPRSGGYQNLDARGNQVLINYRATSEIAQSVTIDNILTGQFDPNWVKNRVVLIGVTAASIQDYHDTPYGRMRGLEVHTHMVSQILSAVQERRPLIWWLPQWADALWVWGWSLIGGIIVYGLRSQNLRQAQLLLQLVLALSICVTFLYGICWIFLLQGAWLPLIPAALGIGSTGGVVAYRRFPSHKNLS
jgi:CHASE2 domain-containing sensor protein